MFRNLGSLEADKGAKVGLVLWAGWARACFSRAHGIEWGGVGGIGYYVMIPRGVFVLMIVYPRRRSFCRRDGNNDLNIQHIL